MTTTYSQTSDRAYEASLDDEEKKIGTPDQSRSTSIISPPNGHHHHIHTPHLNPENEIEEDDNKKFNEEKHHPDPTDWDSPEDPDNPQNWPYWIKIWHSTIPATVAFICTLASSIITPGRDSIQQEFGVSRLVAIIPYVLYVLGLAMGPMISSPCSETFGRRPVYNIGAPLFAIFTLGCGFANNIAALSILRFLAGVFGSPGLAIGAATISDIWIPAERALPMTTFVATPFLGPALGPLIGGFVAQSKGWRWTMWTVLFFTAAFLPPALFTKETYKSVILRRRAKRRGLKYPTPDRTTIQNIKFFTTTTLTRPIHMFCVEPVVTCFTLYVAINFGTLYGFFAAFPFVFRSVYGFNLGEIGLSFLGLAIGVIVAATIIYIFTKLIYKPMVVKSKKAGKGGSVTPEERLYIAMLGSMMLPISLFWFGWTARSDIHWISPVIAEGLFGCGNLLIFMASILYVTDFYGPLYAASAQGANSLVRYVFGAAFPLFATQMYEGLGVGWASSLLGFVSLGLTTIPWVLYWVGPRLRARSSYTVQK